MAKTIEGVSYPDNMRDILKDRDLLAVLRKSFSSIPMLKDSLAFVERPPKPSRVYIEYIAPNAPNKIMVSDRVQKMSTEILKNGGSDDLRFWVKITEMMRNDIMNLFDKKYLSIFFTRQVFEDYHEPKAIAKAKARMGTPSKVAKQLGIKDTALLTELMIANALGRKQTAAKLAAALAKKEKQADLDAKALLKV